MLLVLIFIGIAQVSGQYSISYSDSSGNPLPNQDVHACQEVADSIHVIRIVINDDAADNTGILINFINGMDYLDGSLILVDQIGGLSISEGTGSSPGSIDLVISPPDLNAGDEITFGYSRYANCTAINHQTAGGTFKDYIAVSGGAGVVFEDNPAFANYDLLVPAVSLFNEGPITTTVGSTVTREISIVNGGLGFLNEAELSIDDQTGTNTLSLETQNGTILTPTTSGSVHEYLIDANVISQYGNGDNNLDNGEEIILTRTYEVLSCSCESSYQVDWNCEGACTESDLLPQETIISNSVPNLMIDMPDVDEDVCFDGSNALIGGTPVIQTVRVRNVGTGHAINFSLTMHNYNPGSGRGRHYFSNEAWTVKNESGSVIHTMSNVTVLTSLNYWQANCVSTSQPVVIRQDAEGLIIAPGETVYVDIPVYYNNLICPNCPKGVSWHMFNGQFVYDDICENNTYVIPRDRLFHGGHNFQRYNMEVPTDVHDDECFEIDINYNRVHNTIGKDAASGGSVTAVIDLNGTGLSYQGGPTLSWGNYNLSVQEVGGTLRIEMPVNVITDGQLVVPVCASCDNVSGGAKFLDVWHEVHYSDSCSSDPIIQECKNESFVLHCPAPCPEGGATPLGFNLERITLGLQDLNDDGVPDNGNLADPADVELHRSVNGDMVRARWDIYVHPNTVGPNAGVAFDHLYVEFDTKKVNQSCSPAESNRTSYFNALPNAVATITPADGSASFTCSVNPVVGSDGIATYDLSSCKAGWEGGDEIVFDAMLTVNGFVSRTGESLYISDNEVYSSYVPNPSLADQHTCDIYNDYMYIYNIWHSPYFPATNQILGCDNIMRVYLRQYINIQAVAVWFPNEYRNFVMFDEYIVDWPSYMVYRPGSARFAGKVVPDSDVTQTATQLIFKNLKQFYTPYGGTILPPDEMTNNGQVSWKVDPTCDAEPTFTSRFTALSVGNGENTPSSGWESYTHCTRKYSGTSTITYDAPIPFITGGGTTQPTSNETCWEVNLNNSSNSQDADNTWFYLDDLGGNLNNLTIHQGSSQLSPNSGGLYEIGTNASSSSTSYTICADIENCGDIELELSMGYGCTDYPSSLLTSDCVDSVILEGEPQDSEIQVILDSYPLDLANICDEQVVVLGLTSAQSSYLNDSYVEITLPDGVNFVGNLEMEYPSGSGNWEVVSYTFAGGVYTVNVEDHSGIGPEGLPGTLDDPNELNREINLRFVITYPDTGEGISLSSFGENPCGNDALNNGVTVSTVDLDPLFDDENTEADICPGDSYMWEGDSYTEAGVYEIVNYNDLGCTYLKVLYLSIYDTSAEIEGDTLLNCDILNVSLTALPADLTYSWSNNETTQIINPSDPGIYTVTITDENSCTATSSVEVLQNIEGPEVSVESADICIGDDVMIVATGGGTYSWPDGETTEGITVAPETTTDYIVTVTSENGCTNTATATVTVNPLPDASIFKLRDIMCQPASGYIRATVNYPGVTQYLNQAEFIMGDASCGDQFLEITGDTPYAVVGDNVAGIVSGGETYEFSFRYKNTGPGNLIARVYFYTSAWGYLNYTQVVLPVSGTWTDGFISALAPAGAANVHLGILVYEPNTVQYDCVEFVNASGGPLLFENSFEQSSPYYWEGPSGFAGTSRGIYTYEPGIYYLTITDPLTGCENYGDVEVFEFTDEPGGEITSDGPLTCALTEVSLTASSMITDATFAWSTGGTNATEIVNMIGEYTVTITDPFNNCTTELSIEVTEDIAMPDVSASNDGPITCSLPNVTLTALPAGLSYEWSHGSTEESPMVNLPGEYTVTVTDINGCTASSTTEVLENTDLPVIELEDIDICIGEDGTLVASGGTSYALSNGETTPSITVTITTTTSYTVTVTDTNGCTDTAEGTITVNPLPDNGITVWRDILCAPSPGHIYANQAYPNVPNYLDNAEYQQGDAGCGDQHVQITGVSPYSIIGQNLPGVLTAGNSYDFSFKYRLSGTGLTRARIVYFTSAWAFISQDLVTLTPTSSWTDYSFTRTAPPGAVHAQVGLLVTAPAVMDYDCVEFKETSGAVIYEEDFEINSPYEWSGPNGPAGLSKGIYVTEPGTYYLTVTDPVTGCQNFGNIEVIENITPPDGTLTNDGPLTCSKTEVTLTVVSTTTGATYLWEDSTTASTTTVTDPGTYSVTITDPVNGCTTILQTEVTQNITPPNPEVSNDGPITCDDLTVTLTATPAGLTYAWPDGTSNQTTDVTTPGEYILTVTDVNGCTATATTEVLEDIDPPMADAGTDASQCADEDTQLSASGGVSYAWSPAESLSDASIANPIASPSVTTTYTVTVTGDNGCTATDEVLITIDQVTIDVTTGSTTCKGECTGSITVTVDYAVIGDFNLSYDFNGSTVSLGPFTSSDPVVIEDLCAGDYFNFSAEGVSNGCSVFWAGPSVVNEQSVEWEHVSHASNVSNCSGICDGAFIVDANLGLTGEFIVAFTYNGNVSVYGPYDFAGDILFDDLCAGTYSDITITSVGSLCSVAWPDDIEILEPIPQVEIVQIENDECQEEAGTTTLSVSGGSAPYTISWNSLDGSDAGSTVLTNDGNITIEGLIGGNTYCFEVEDANGCSYP